MTRWACRRDAVASAVSRLAGRDEQAPATFAARPIGAALTDAVSAMRTALAEPAEPNRPNRWR